MKIEIPNSALVLLVGASGTGKSSFAAKHFLPTEVISSDRMRGWVADDETDQSATGDAFDVLHYVVEKRLKGRRLDRHRRDQRPAGIAQGLVALARKWHALAVAIVFDLPEALAVARNAERPDRQFGAGPVRRQHAGAQALARRHEPRGHPLRPPRCARSRRSTRSRSRARGCGPTAARRRGPFDIIGDVHGCADELETLLGELGYAVAWDGKQVERHAAGGPPRDLRRRPGRSRPALARRAAHRQAHGREPAPRWPWSATMTTSSSAISTGRNVKVSHGLAETIEQLAQETARIRAPRCAMARRPDQPLCARRRQARRRACRAQGGDAGPRVGRGAQLLHVWRDHRRDRRVRSAGALGLGGRLQGQGQGGLRPHAGARSATGSTARSASTPAACSAAS